MQRVLITGSSGYLGTGLVEALHPRAGVATLGVDIVEPWEVAPDEFVKLDIRDRGLSGVVESFRPDTIIHAAFVVRPMHDEREMEEINVGGTNNVLEAVAASHPRRFMFTSSATALGAWPDNPVPMPDDWTLRGRRDFSYAWHKTLLEEKVKEFAERHPEMVVSWVRPCIVGGPRMENYLRRFLFGMPVMVVLDGVDTGLQFVHEEDVTAAIVAILDQDARGPFNIAPPDWLHVRDVAREVGLKPFSAPLWLARAAATTGWKLRFPLHEYPPGFLHFCRHPWVVAPQRLTEELGFAFPHSSLDTLQAIVASWRRRAGRKRMRRASILGEQLRVSPFEESLLVDDRPGYPWNFFLRLRLRGEVNRAAVEGALLQTISRHPLLAATIRRNSRGDLDWLPVENPAPPVRWLEAPPGDAFPNFHPINIEKEIGVRLAATTKDGSCQLVFQFHHVCCDGLGGVQFVEDFLAAYANCAGGEYKIELPPLSRERLWDRESFGWSAKDWLQKASRQAIGLKGARQFLMRQAAPLIRHVARPEEPAPPADFPTAVGHSFSAEETARLLAASRREGATLNEVLARDLFLALHAFRSRLGRPKSSDWLRLLIPMNMRTAIHEGLSAANVVSSIFLDRRRKDFADARRLLNGIRTEMREIKENELGYTYLMSLHAARLLPGGIEAQQWGDRCVATAILSNLGRVIADARLLLRDGKIEAGGLVLERFGFFPPVRPYTCTSFGVGTYAGRLNVWQHYDSRVLSEEQARELLAIYVEKISDSAGGSKGEARGERGERRGAENYG